MFKKYKWSLIITSLIILLPIYFGYCLWDELPEMIATHWGVDNQPNGYSSKAMTVYGMPLIMLALQCFSLLMMELDIKKKNHSPKMISLMLWIIPLLSVLVNVVIYSYALGIKLNVGFWALFGMGIIFIVIGNYLPKCRQNWTVGIKLPWTLEDPDNWNRTHRLAGPLWMTGGIIITVASFFSTHKIVNYGLIFVFILMVLVPTVYSYLYYKKHNKE